jgi:Holliday junction resolvase RusA-like endonuclease
MKIINFIIQGKPEPKGRPRLNCKGKPYTPPKTKKWEQDIALQAKQYAPKELLCGALSITLIFSLPRPKSLPKGTLQHTKKPDLDNLVKAGIDGLEGIIFKGDQQITRLTAFKQYCDDNEPGMSVEVRTLD